MHHLSKDLHWCSSSVWGVCESLHGSTLVKSRPILIAKALQCLRNQRNPPYRPPRDRPGGFLLSDLILTQHTETTTDSRPPDTNVAGGLWSTAEVQVGFICANLPHKQHLASRCFRRSRPSAWHGGGSSSNDRHSASNTRIRSRHNTGGFQNLGSLSKSTAPGPVTERDAEREDSSREEANIGAYDSDHELISVGAPCENSVGRVEVRTEVRQEVQRIESPRALARERGGGDDAVSTEITAKGACL